MHKYNVNKYVFSRRLKLSLSRSGSLKQYGSDGPATEKAREGRTFSISCILAYSQRIDYFATVAGLLQFVRCGWESGSARWESRAVERSEARSRTLMRSTISLQPTAWCLHGRACAMTFSLVAAGALKMQEWKCGS